MAAVKMKVGAEPASDPHRVRVARDALGPDIELYVDANGTWPRHDAVHRAHELDRAAGGIRWLEEPVSSQDLHGLRAVRSATPAGMPVAAGEYLWTPEEAQRLLAAEAVDVIQADATRCLGLTATAPSAPSPPHADCLSRPIAPLRCTPTPPAACSAAPAWSTSMTPSGSSGACSRARPSRTGACSRSTAPGQGTA